MQYAELRTLLERERRNATGSTVSTKTAEKPAPVKAAEPIKPPVVEPILPIYKKDVAIKKADETEPAPVTDRQLTRSIIVSAVTS